MIVKLSQSAFELGIQNPVVCLIQHVKMIPGPNEALKDRIAALMERVKNEGELWLNKPEVKGFKVLFETMGYPKQIPAGERLLKSFSQRGFKQFDNIVDAYNLVSLEHVAGIGMHDAENLLSSDAPLVIRRAQQGLTIIPSFDQKQRAVKVIPNDLVYGIESDSRFDVMAWLGKQDKDSDLHKVTEKTTALVLVVLGNIHTSEAHNRKVCEDILINIQLTCPEATMEILPVEKEGVMNPSEFN